MKKQEQINKAELLTIVIEGFCSGWMSIFLPGKPCFALKTRSIQTPDQILAAIRPDIALAMDITMDKMVNKLAMDQINQEQVSSILKK
jgi:hypothetical protein